MKKAIVCSLSLLLSSAVYADNVDALPDNLKPLSDGQLISHGIKTIPLDLENITLYPVDNPKKTLIATGAIIGLIAVDKPLTKFVQDHINPLFRSNVPSLFHSSLVSGTDAYVIVGLGGLYVSSLAMGNQQGQVATIDSTKAIGYSYLYSQLILKTMFGRARPNPNLAGGGMAPDPYSNDPWDFFNFHGPQFNSNSAYSSMPSYHFTMFFSVATALHNVYGSYIPYGLVLAGLLPNFQGHHHWVSDMVAGGLVGTVIGNEVTSDYATGTSQDDKHGHLAFYPVPMPGAVGIGATYTFN